MRIKLMNVVVFAEEYQLLVNWYKEVFDFEEIHKEKGGYNYVELGMGGDSIIGITPAKEIDHIPSTPRNNASVLQLQVSEIASLFERVKKKKGTILFGPSSDEVYGFQYGGIADLEGNQIWIVEEHE